MVGSKLLKILTFFVLMVSTIALPAFANQTMYAFSPMALQSNPIGGQTPQWISSTYEIGTQFTVLDNQSRPGFVQVQRIEANGQVTTGWTPEVNLATENPLSPTTPRVEPSLPPNQVCHNRTMPHGEVAINGTVTSSVFIQENFGNGLVNCPQIPQLSPGTPLKVLPGQEQGTWSRVRAYSEQAGYIYGWVPTSSLNIPEGQLTEAQCTDCGVAGANSELRDVADHVLGPNGQAGYQDDRYVGFRAVENDEDRPWCSDHKARLNQMGASQPIQVSAQAANSIARAGVDMDAFNRAYDFYLNNQGIIRNNRYITIVDYSRPSWEERYHVIDLHSGQVDSYLTQHGNGGGDDHDGMAENFSNIPGSNMSSLGISITGFRFQPCDYGMHYQGRFRPPAECRRLGLDSNIDGHRLSLHGQEWGDTEREGNYNNCGRAIVGHGDSNFEHSGGMWRSNGCPTIPAGQWDGVLDRIEGGSVFYTHN